MSFSIFLTSTIVVVFVVSLLFVMIKKKKHEKLQDQKRLPPGPKKLPLIGNLHQLGQPPHRSLQRLSTKHGPLMFLQLGSVPSLVVSSADMAKQIFKTNDLIFSSRPVLYGPNKLSYNGSDISFSPYGDYWRQLRKLTVLELLSAKRIQAFEAIREEEVSLMIKSVASLSSTTTLINISEMMLLLSSNVVQRAVFGKKGDDESENGRSKFHDILHETQEMLGMVNFADYFPWMWWVNKFNGVEARLEKNFRELDMFYDQVIEEHHRFKYSSTSEHEDFVSVLLRIQNDPNQEVRLTNENIKGVLTDMFVAGTDTSAATLVWIMTQLIKNPSAMRKAQDEVRRISNGEKGLKVKENDLQKLDYLKLVVKETLRLHPPAPLLVPRETTESCTIAGYHIPAKARVFINVTAISMDSEYWENPEEFKPERFLNSSIDFRGQNFEYLPFGAGRRGCPGTNFAILFVELVLANLLHSFDWELPQGIRADDIDLDETVGMTVHKKTPLCLAAIAQ